MQKKILLSLLVASPTAFPAMANVDFGHGDWVNSGMTGPNDTRIDNEKGDVTCSLGSGVTTWTQKNLPVGTYQLSFSKTENLSLVVSGAASATLNSGTTGATSVTFKVEKAGDVTFTAKGETANQYIFTGARLQLLFDFKAAGTAANDLLKTLPGFAEINANVAEDTKTKLNTEKAKLEASKSLLGNQATSLENVEAETNESDTAKLLGYYRNLELYNDPSKLTKNIYNLNDSIEDWNNKVLDTNKPIVNKEANTKSMEAYLAGVTILNDNLEALKTNIEKGVQYLKDENLSSVDAIQAKIDAYENAINNAFEDLTVDPATIKIESQVDAIQAEIDALEAKWTGDVADWKAYSDFMNVLYPDLQNKYNAAVDAVNKLMGVKGQELVFDWLKDEYVQNLTSAFTTAKNDMKITAAAGAAALLEGDQATADAAAEGFQALVDEVTATVNTQNKNYTTVTTEGEGTLNIPSLKNKLESYKLTTVPTALAEAYNKAYNEIESLINELVKFVKTEYADAKLDITSNGKGTYVYQYNTIVNKLYQFNQEYTTPFADLYLLDDEFEKAKKDIQNLSDSINIDGFNLYGLFEKEDGTFDSIENSIENIETGEELANQKDAISKAIKDAVDTAKKLANAMLALEAGKAQYAADVTELAELVENKIELTKDGKAGATTLKDEFTSKDGEGGKFKAAADKFNADLTDIIDETNPQALYDAATKLAEDNKIVKVESTTPAEPAEGEVEEPATKVEYTFGWTENLETIELGFAKTVTEANNKVLTDLIAAAKELVATENVTGLESISFNEIDEAAGKIATDIAAAQTTEDYAVQDQAILDLIPELDPINELANKYIENQNNYNNIKLSLKGEDGEGGLQAKINELVQHNIDNSQVPALEYFANLINGEDNTTSLQAQLNDILKDLDDALAAYADKEKNVTATKGDFELKIGLLKDAITQTTTDIDNNETSHDGQLTEAENVASQIVNALISLEKKYNNQTNIQVWYDGVKNRLDSIRDNALFNNNVAVANAYGQGACFAQDSTLMGEYKRISNEIKNITDTLNSDYEQAVVTANEEVVSKAGWDTLIANMNKEYVEAITVFNNYQYGITNPGWKEFVGDKLKSHEGIYQYSTMINELISKVNTYISNNNAKPVTFTSEDFDQYINNATEGELGANNIIQAIQDAVNALNTEMSNLAQKYYGKLQTKATAQIQGYEKQLNDAGIVSDCLKDVQGALTDAETKYATATGENATDPLGIAMDAIAWDLDKALTVVDLQPEAVKAWDKAYNNATTKVQKTLDGLDEYKFATKEVKKAVVAAINDILDQMSDLDKEVKEVTEDLIDSYKEFADRLAALLADVETEAAKVQASNDNNFANEKYYNELTTVTIPDLEKEYQALVNYAGTLGGGQTFMKNEGAQIAGLIATLKNFVEENKSTLKDNEDKITTDKETISTEITKGYTGVAYDESQLLEEFLSNLKVAFNNAKAAFNGADGTESKLDKKTGEKTINGWNEEIDSWSNDITNLAAMIGAPADFEKEDFQAEAQKLEKEMGALFATIEQSWTSNNHDGNDPLTGVLNALTDEYKNVLGEIAKVQSYLDEDCAGNLDTTGYQKELDAESTNLNDQKTEWEGLGDRVLTMQDKYIANMGVIYHNITALLAKIKAANEKAIQENAKKQANEEAYATLSGELKDLKAELERVAELARGWYGDSYNGTISAIETEIANTEEALQNDYDNEALTADSVLQNKAKIAGEINSLEVKVTLKKAGDTKAAAATALRNAEVALAGNLVPNVKAELDKKYYALFNEYNEKANIPTDATLEDLQGLIADFERIADEANALKGEVSENVYVPGDVELNPDGLVTAADVQQIVTWILDRMTWANLEKENARQAYAADLNGDKTLNITDVTMDISLVYGEPTSMRKLKRFAAPIVENNCGVNIALVVEENGIRRYAVTLDNTMPIIAGQFDLQVAAGSRIADITLGERDRNHELQYKENESGTRVLIYSMDNAEFDATSGAVLYIDVEGAGKLSLNEAVITDTYFDTHTFGAMGSSIVDSIMESAKNVKERIYNAAGIMYNKLQNGINIIRDSNGKTRKEIRRK